MMYLAYAPELRLEATYQFSILRAKRRQLRAADLLKEFAERR